MKKNKRQILIEKILENSIDKNKQSLLLLEFSKYTLDSFIKKIHKNNYAYYKIK